MPAGLRVVVVLAIVAATSTVRADDAPKPWAVGVSEPDMATAQQLLAEGNAQFVAKRYTEALDRYTRAIAVWDHPAIRFNIVRCLIQLGRNLEAYSNLEKALRYGSAPLEDAVYEEALNYQKLLGRQVADVVVRCEQPGVTVTLDGQQLIACPGEQRRRVEPGPHQVVGTRSGFATATIERVVLGGSIERFSVELAPADAPVSAHGGWKPWVVALSGVVAVGVGGVFQVQSSRELDRFEREVDRVCTTVGCNDDGAFGQPVTPREHERAARRDHRLAIGSWIVGAAAIATGATWLYVGHRRRERIERRVTVISVPSGAGLAIGGGF